MAIEIYYFSGTGNSFFVARELQKLLPGCRLIPIAGLLQGGAVRASGEAVGIVFPVHALTIPIAVKRFLKKLDPGSAGYVFAVATRLGTVFRGFAAVEKLLGKKRKRLDAAFILNMCSNDVKVEGYRAPTEDEILRLENAVREKLPAIAAAVADRKTSREPDRDSTVGFGHGPLINRLLERFVVACLNFSEHIGGVNYFRADANCTGCGICEMVCLSRKIGMVDGRPAWRKDVFCYMCYACINYCPQQAVQIDSIPGVKSYSRQNGRYSHPYATAKEIAAQKSR